MSDSQQNLLALDDSSLLLALQKATLTENQPTIARAKQLIGTIRSAIASHAPQIRTLNDEDLLQTLQLATASPNLRTSERGKELLKLARTAMILLFEKEKVSPLDPQLLKMTKEEEGIAGLADFKRLLGEIAQGRASSVLEYFRSDDWIQSVKKITNPKNPTNLRFKIPDVYKLFWKTLGTDFRKNHPEEFATLSTALKKLLPLVGLTTYQEKPGKLERDVKWYQAEPSVTFYQNSTVEEVLRPGLQIIENGERDYKALVKIKP